MKGWLLSGERLATPPATRIVLSALAGVILLLTGCATSSGTPPEWLQGNSREFPPVRYLTGQGQADTAAVARDRARSELVKVFEASIAEESRDVSSATRETADGWVKQSSELKAERSVSVTTARTVEGIEIAEVWRDPERNSYHALAVLDRLRAGEVLRSEIRQLDEVTARELRMAQEAPDTLLQIASAFRATAAQQQRGGLQRDLRIIDPTGVGVPSRWDLAQLDSDLYQTAKRLRLSAEVGEDPVGNLHTILSGAIARAGFTHVSGEEAPYRLHASLQLDPTQSNGWHWARGVLQLTLKDSEGKVRGAHQFPIKAAGQQPAVARQRAMGEVDRVLRAQLRDTILGIAVR